jgi:hypothetical protein
MVRCRHQYLSEGPRRPYGPAHVVGRVDPVTKPRRPAAASDDERQRGQEPAPCWPGYRLEAEAALPLPGECGSAA